MDVPAVAHTLTGIRDVLLERCEVPRTSIRTVLDAPSPVDLGDALAEVTGQAAEDGALLVCFAGHGLKNASGELYLATSASLGDAAAGPVDHRALPYSMVRSYVSRSRARTRVVILDCCYSGRAAGRFENAAEFAGLTEIAGSYVLTSAGHNTLAVASDEAGHTAFLGALIDWIREGEPGGSQELTLDGAFRHLAGRLPALGCPRPQRSVTGLAGDLVLAANPLWRPAPETPSTSPPPAPRAPGTRCPYPGLAAFTERDIGTFFGRQPVVAALLRRLALRWAQPAALVMYGASGCGKTSLLRAGLLPAVARGELDLPGSADWPRLVFTPATDPVRSVATALVPLLATTGRPADVDTLTEDLERDPRRLAELLARATDTDGRVLLVADQFEEVFTQCTDETARDWLITALDHAATGSGGAPAALVVLSVRADFNDRFADYPLLRAAMSASPFIVGPMTADQITEAIRCPADAEGLALQPGLVDLMLDDLEVGRAGNEAGRLPLLAHALRATWHQRDNGVLTLDGYQSTGRITGALGATADRALAALGPQAADDARLLLLRLVRIGDHTRDTRRHVPEGQLLAELPDPDLAHSILDAFSAEDTRLVTRDDARVQITHEALLDAWPRLRAWLDEDRAGELLRQHLVDAAHQWDQAGRRATDLHRGSRLDLERRWAGNPDHHRALDPVSRAFLEAGTEQEEAERRTARRRVRVLAAGSLVLAGLLVFALIQWRSAVHERGITAQQRRTAVARSLVSRADVIRADTPTAALRLDLAAQRIWPSDETRAALSRAVAGFGAQRTLVGHDDAIRKIAVSPDGTLLASGDNGGNILLWNTARPERPARTAVLHVGNTRVNGLSISPDGRLLAAVGPDGAVDLWSLARPAHPTRVAVLHGPFGPGGVVTFNPRHNVLAVDGARADGSGTVELWDVARPTAPRRLSSLTVSRRQQGVYTAAFSRDGRTLAAGSRDGTVKLWDVADPAHPTRTAEFDAHSIVTSLALSPDGRLLASETGAATKPQLWSLSAGHEPRPVASLPGHTQVSTGLAFSPDGRVLGATGADRTTLLWDVSSPSTPRRLATLTGHDQPVTDLAFTPDGRWLFTGSYDRTLRIWPLRERYNPHAETSLVAGPAKSTTAEAVAQTPDGHTLVVGGYSGDLTLWTRGRTGSAPQLSATWPSGQQGVVSAAFSPDGQILATAGLDATARLWRMTPTGAPRLLARVTGHTDYVQGVAFSPDGRTLATAGHDRRLTLWDLTRPGRPARLTDLSFSAAVGFAEFSPDRRTLLIGTADNKYPLTAWDVTTRSTPRLLSRFSGFSGSVFSVALDKRGRTVAAASGDGNVLLWNLSDPRRPQRIATVQAHHGIATAVALSPDGHLLYSGGYEDASVKVWNLMTAVSPRPLTTLPAHGNVTGMAMSADGLSIATGTESGQADWWKTGDFADYLRQPALLACGFAGRGLTTTEWEAATGGLARQATCPAPSSA
ncbi:hypothetical protein ACFWPQ_44040 [Streptomyces sp. NPDC058464]|uniref:caspase, EACC1-associated type n=1 Tax=Streptomyces sp. NPDC058464 TaxID=3346511 RepID=UPI0036616E19